MTLEFTIDIRAPVDVVFCWITQRDKVKHWLPLVENRITRDTGGRVGTRLSQVYESDGRRVRLAVEVLKFVTNRCLMIQFRTKKQDSVFAYRVEPRASGTRLTVAIDIHLLGYMKLVGFLIGESLYERISRDCLEDFGRLKRLCERACTS